jgi:hypothetical protein
MATWKSREIKARLVKKGFKSFQRHHTYLFLYVDGRKSRVHTKISHGIKEYGDDLLPLVARELKISPKQLDELLSCPLTYEGYISILKTKKFLII